MNRNYAIRLSVLLSFVSTISASIWFLVDSSPSITSLNQYSPITLDHDQFSQLQRVSRDQFDKVPNSPGSKKTLYPEQALANAQEQRENNRVPGEKIQRTAQQIFTNFRRKQEELQNQPQGALRPLARGVGQKVLNPEQQEAIDALQAQLGEATDLQMDNLSGTLRFLDGDLKKIVQSSEAYQDARSRDNFSGMALALTQELGQVMKIQNPAQEFATTDIFTDDLGMTHVRMQQTYRGAPVWGAEVGVHFNAAGDPVQISGVYSPTPNLPVPDQEISVEQAIAIAQQAVPPKSDYLVDPRAEKMVYWDIDRAAAMAYRVDLTPAYHESWQVFISSIDGKIIHQHNQVCTQAHIGRSNNLDDLAQDFNCWFDGTNYYAIDISKPMYAASSQPPSLKKMKGAIVLLDAQNANLDAGNVSLYDIVSTDLNKWDATAVSVMHNFGVVEDYFRKTHGRNSIDNSGMNIVAIIHAQFDEGGSIGSDNAFWNSGAQMMVFGDGSSAFRHLPKSLDVTGHELTHGVIDHSAKLIYENQSGALNEHIADFFGAMIDRDDWFLGDGITVGKDGLRDMQNPGNSKILSGQPSKMSEFENLPNTANGDWGGVHVNSGIPNRMSYLLCEGPQGIGRDKAEKIIYRALTNYLTQRSTFVDYRRACESAAKDLFGENSAEVNAVRSSFDAVEVFASNDGGSPTPTPGTPTQGNELMLFLFADLNTLDPVRDDFYYGLAINNGSESGLVSQQYVVNTRPAISGDGEWALFVNHANDIYWTNGNTNDEEQWTDSADIRSIAMSKNQRFIAFTTIDYVNEIHIIDTTSEQLRTAKLVYPQTNGTSAPVEFADILTFNFRGDFIVYDALVNVRFNNAETVPIWGMFTLRLVDLASQQLIAPVPGEEIGNPTFSHTSDQYLLADLLVTDGDDVLMGLLSLDIVNGNSHLLGGLPDLGHPSYRGDDKTFLYRYHDFNNGTAYLLENVLSNDRSQVVNEQDSIVLSMGVPLAYPVGFRFGQYQQAEPDISVPAALTFGDVQVTQQSQRELVISNPGNGDLKINALTLEGANQQSFSHNGVNQLIPAGGQMKFDVLFKPTTAGNLNATLRIISNDFDNSEVTVALSGMGVASQNDTPTPSQTPTPIPAEPTATLPPVQPTSTPTTQGPAFPTATPLPSGSTVVYEFEKNSLAESGWAEIPGGFQTGTPGGTVRLGGFGFGNPISSSADKRGLSIEVVPGQVAFLYASQPVKTLGRPVLVRAVIRSDNPNVTVVLGALKGVVSTGESLDGSISTHMPTTASSFIDRERQLVFVYEPDSGENITPLIQVAAGGGLQGTATVLVDKLEAIPLDPNQTYAGSMFKASMN